MYELIIPKEPILKTERLILRPLTVADAQAVLNGAAIQACTDLCLIRF